MTIRSLLFIALLWGSFFFALVKGGRSERAAAIVILVGVELSHFTLSPAASRYRGIESALFAIDIVTFAAFFAIMLFSRKYWPMWMTAMQGVTLMAHLSGTLPDIIPNAYSNAVQLWSWPILVTLAVGTWFHMRDTTRQRSTARWQTPA